MVRMNRVRLRVGDNVNRIQLRLREGYQGVSYIDTFAGNYSVQSNCMLTWKYEERNGSATGLVHGIIVSADKLFLMFSNPAVLSSGRVSAERIKY